KNDPCVLLPIPRGGVPVAFVIAEELGFPVDIVLIKKIGHPLHKEYAIGAVSLTDSYIVPHEEVSKHYIEKETEHIHTRLRKMYSKFMGDKELENLEGKTVIIVDDGIATGNTLMATVKMLKKSHPHKLIIATPVASETAIEKLSKEADEVICPFVPEIFFGVSGFYERFDQTTDEEVMFYLDKLRTEKIIQ
ncbi:MAG TPA: phosphoribosyltransferase family protein, partial [Chitinophagaceae bacterium]|nr:phosphoribosyltransferase family protein [Chitinophagaceae bacterium]